MAINPPTPRALSRTYSKTSPCARECGYSVDPFTFGRTRALFYMYIVYNIEDRNPNSDFSVYTVYHSKSQLLLVFFFFTRSVSLLYSHMMLFLYLFCCILQIRIFVYFGVFRRAKTRFLLDKHELYSFVDKQIGSSFDGAYSGIRGFEKWKKKTKKKQKKITAFMNFTFELLRTNSLLLFPFGLCIYLALFVSWLYFERKELFMVKSNKWSMLTHIEESC